MDAARSAGVPTPRVLEVGNAADGRPYMISERVQGIDGRTGAASAWMSSSRSAARPRSLHTIRTRGFGPVFDWSSNTLSRHESWRHWLVEGFDVERRIGMLLRHRMIDARQASRLRRRAAEMARWRKPPVLHHGDLRLKNAIVDRRLGSPARGPRLGELHLGAGALLGSVAVAARPRHRREGGVSRRLWHEAARRSPPRCPMCARSTSSTMRIPVESAVRKGRSGTTRALSLAPPGRARPVRSVRIIAGCPGQVSACSRRQPGARVRTVLRCQQGRLAFASLATLLGELLRHSPGSRFSSQTCRSWRPT